MRAAPATQGRQPATGSKRPSWWEPRSSITPRGRDLAGRYMACPTPSRKRPPTNPPPEPTHGSAVLIDGRLRWLYRLPLVLSRHATVSTVPRVHEDGQTARPGNRRGRTMAEASVSFAGNLTDDPEVRYTDSGIARAMFRVAVSGRRGAGGVVLHRDRVARPGRARRAVPGQGQPGCGHGPTPAADLDRRGRQRPVAGRGRGRGAGTKLALGDGKHDQGDA